MIHRTHLSAVFFDFDGVIADSLTVKKDAFATLFASYGRPIQDAVVRYHEAHGGMPRQEKLRHCLEAIACVKATNERVAELAAAFSNLVFQKVIEAPLMPGARECLKGLQSAGIPAFIVSGTPQEEMHEIVQAKELVPFFCEVHGSPRIKAVIINDILTRFQLSSTNCLFLGDALADYEATLACGLHFLGIVPEGRENIFPDAVTISSQVDSLNWPF
jgi:beta-phosphoglucomutase-like phosphatase (HAD superfamily)